MDDKEKRVGITDREVKDIGNDNLNIAPTVQGLCYFIENCDSPKTISISGEWGSGKTSLMEMVENALLKNKKHIHDQEAMMQVSRSLMQEIDALLEDADERYEYVKIAQEDLFYEIKKVEALYGSSDIIERLKEELVELKIEKPQYELEQLRRKYEERNFEQEGELIENEERKKKIKAELEKLEAKKLCGRLASYLSIKKQTLLELDKLLLVNTDGRTRLTIISQIEEYWENEVLECLKECQNEIQKMSDSVFWEVAFWKVEKFYTKPSILNKLKAYLPLKDAEQELNKVEKKIQSVKEIIVPVDVATMERLKSKIEYNKIKDSTLMDRIKDLNKDTIPQLECLLHDKDRNFYLADLYKHIVLYQNEIAKMLAIVFSINQKLRRCLNEYESRVLYQEKFVSEFNAFVTKKKELNEDLNKEIIKIKNEREQLINIALQYVNVDIIDIKTMFEQINELLGKQKISKEDFNESVRKLNRETKEMWKAEWSEFNSGWCYYSNDGEELDTFYSSVIPEDQCKAELMKLWNLFSALIAPGWYDEDGKWYYWEPGYEEDTEGEDTGYKTTETIAQCKQKIRKDLAEITEYPAYQKRWIEYLIAEINAGEYTTEKIDKEIDKKKKETGDEIKKKLMDVLKRYNIHIDIERLTSLYQVSVTDTIKENENANCRSGEIYHDLETLLFEHRYAFYENTAIYPFGNYNIIPVWFDTWQYATFSLGNNLAKSLFDSVFVALREKRRPYIKWAGNFLKRFTPFLMGTTFGINDPVDSFFNSLKSDDYKDYAEELTKLKGSLYDLIVKKTETGKGKKLVIFIDNLDRLQPVKAVELIEILKLFFDCPNCIFVLAVDEEAVMQGVKEKYGKDLGDVKAKEFFEKIVQLPLRLPEQNYDLEKYIVNHVKKIFAGINAEHEEFTSDDFKWFENCIYDFNCRNPRKLKRFFNMYQFFCSLVIRETKNTLFSVKFLQALYLTTALKAFNTSLYNVVVNEIEERREKVPEYIEFRTDVQGQQVLKEFLKSGKSHDVENADYLAAAVEATQLNVHGLLQKYFYQEWTDLDIWLDDEFSYSAHIIPLLDPFNKYGSSSFFNGYNRLEKDEFGFEYLRGEHFNGFQEFDLCYEEAVHEQLYWRASFIFRSLKTNYYTMDITVYQLSNKSFTKEKNRIFEDLNGVLKEYFKEGFTVKREEMRELSEINPELLQEETKMLYKELAKNHRSKESDEKERPKPKIDELTHYIFSNARVFNAQKEGIKEIDECVSGVYKKLKQFFENRFKLA